MTLLSVMRRGGPSSASSLTSFSLERNRLSRDLPLKSCCVMKWLREGRTRKRGGERERERCTNLLKKAMHGSS